MAASRRAAQPAVDNATQHSWTSRATRRSWWRAPPSECAWIITVRCQPATSGDTMGPMTAPSLSWPWLPVGAPPNRRSIMRRNILGRQGQHADPGGARHQDRRVALDVQECYVALSTAGWAARRLAAMAKKVTEPS